MRVVVDASVMLKWLLVDPLREADTEHATALMQSVVAGATDILQPAHWLVEVGAVLARLSPDTAADDIEMLYSMELPCCEDPQVMRRGCELAIACRQHLFNTLYHAVALETADAVLVTADERYLRAARHSGRLLALRDWQPAR